MTGHDPGAPSPAPAPSRAPIVVHRRLRPVVAVVSFILESVEVWIAGSALIGGVLISFYAVFTRYVLNAPAQWTDDVIVWLVIWPVFLIAGRNVLDDRHIGVEYFVSRLSFSRQRVLRAFTSLLALLYSLVILYYGMRSVQRIEASGLETSNDGIPIWILQVVVPIGGFLLVVRWIQRIALLVWRPDGLVHTGPGEADEELPMVMPDVDG